MPNPYSDEPIETLEDWNSVLTCCCPMPSCPVPEMECESRSGSEVSTSTTYSRAYQEWIDGGSVGDPPPFPEGYYEHEHGSWLPFIEPEDPVSLYRDKWFESKIETSGTVKNWYAASGFYPNTFAISAWSTWTGGAGSMHYLSNSWQFNYDSFICGGLGGFEVVEFMTPVDEDLGPVLFPSWASISWTDVDADPCTATTREVIEGGTKRQATAGGSASDQHQIPTSCNTSSPPPFTADPTGWQPANNWEWTNLTETNTQIETLGESVSKQQLIDWITEDIEGWLDPPEETGCVAVTGGDWPVVGDTNWPSPWPACDSTELPIALEATVTQTKSRFKWVIPNTFVGSYFKITWDILEEPSGWDSKIDDPDYEPPEPSDPPEPPDPIPQIPDPNAPQRSFYLTDQTWEWTGPGDPEDEDSWKSGWYEIEPPVENGERRVVNIRFECYHGTKYGVRPQVTGEAVELPT